MFERVAGLVDNLDKLDNSKDWIIFKQAAHFIINRSGDFRCTVHYTSKVWWAGIEKELLDLKV
jgi:hypothetical protein